MAGKGFHQLKRWHQRALDVMRSPTALAFLPALCLGGFWLGGEGALMALAGAVPCLYLVMGGVARAGGPSAMVGDIADRTTFEDIVSDISDAMEDSPRQSALYAIAIEDFDMLVERYGQTLADTVVERTGQRIISVLRSADRVGQLAEGRFAVCLAPVRNLDLESCIQLGGRMQVAIEEPISVDGVTIYVTVGIGFCQRERAPGGLASDWIEAAACAMRVALRRGPSGLRAFSDQMRQETLNRAALYDEVGGALDGGQIVPWFQPQICTETGKVTGFEALARWCHPTRGMISPAEFLPAIEQSGLLERLAEVMMYHSFAALKAWDGAKISVPHVGVNFAGTELSNPRLIEKISWELDRFDLQPERLAVEVLETVVADTGDDVITRNIASLSEMGCQIDLDDFGTGNASIASIQRFSVSRIKIDRSFVMKADRDPDQQRMISAILTMAERLGVQTLAEGVETVGEHVLLAQLGCDHVQGFGIAWPMPFDQTIEWLHAHNTKLKEVPRIMTGRLK
ncbi:MAG: GGDEF domain-containing phosphodiesterase [Pseudomonadota bacterium]